MKLTHYTTRVATQPSTPREIQDFLHDVEKAMELEFNTRNSRIKFCMPGFIPDTTGNPAYKTIIGVVSCEAHNVDSKVLREIVRDTKEVIEDIGAGHAMNIRVDVPMPINPRAKNIPHWSASMWIHLLEEEST
jgi:hypothetical protein